MHAMGGGLKKRVVCTTSSFHFVEIEKVYEIFVRTSLQADFCKVHISLCTVSTYLLDYNLRNTKIRLITKLDECLSIILL